jgi:thiol-disulfide isomerase/thioredoxin
MNWKIIAVGLTALVLLCIISYFYYTTSGFKRQGFTNPSKHEFIMYHAEWCGHCKKAKPEFDTFSGNGTIVVGGQEVVVKAYENDANKDKIDEAKARGVEIEGFPTFVLTTTNGSVYKYEGPRKAEEYLKFLNEKLGGGIQ